MEKTLVTLPVSHSDTLLSAVKLTVRALESQWQKPIVKMVVLISIVRRL